MRPAHQTSQSVSQVRRDHHHHPPTHREHPVVSWALFFFFFFCPRFRARVPYEQFIIRRCPGRSIGDAWTSLGIRRGLMFVQVCGGDVEEEEDRPGGADETDFRSFFFSSSSLSLCLLAFAAAVSGPHVRVSSLGDQGASQLGGCVPRTSVHTCFGFWCSADPGAYRSQSSALIDSGYPLLAQGGREEVWPGLAWARAWAPFCPGD